MKRALLLAASMLALSGCVHMPGQAQSAGAGDKGAGGNSDQISSAIASAAQDAADEGMNEQSLMFQEKLYQQDPRDPKNIINYAKALRRAGRIDDALLVIRTPAKAAKAGEPLKTEAAMVLLSAGKYEEALQFAQDALAKSEKSPQAHEALALAMSGMGKNEDAEQQFRVALDMWPQDADNTAPINNLAMSLAAQGKITEAKNVMSQATGEALQSPAYQNNRALLDTLHDREIVKENIDDTKVMQTVSSTTVTTSPAPKNAKLKTPAGKMKPIIN